MGFLEIENAKLTSRFSVLGRDLKLDADAPRRGLMSRIADEEVGFGNDVGEAVLAIDPHVDHVGDAVADAGGETVFEAVHGFAAS